MHSVGILLQSRIDSYKSFLSRNDFLIIFLAILAEDLVLQFDWLWYGDVVT